MEIKPVLTIPLTEDYHLLSYVKLLIFSLGFERFVKRLNDCLHLLISYCGLAAFLAAFSSLAPSLARVSALSFTTNPQCEEIQ